MAEAQGYVAVVLSGCGVFDGTEPHEAAAVCASLTRLGKTPVFFAPDKKMYHEVNHVTGEDDNTSRNVLVESGRIARGKVFPLSELDVKGLEAVVIPGGFGAAKNLCSYAVSPDPEVDQDIARVLRDTMEAGKPMGMCCISPIIAALVFAKGEGKAIKITLGRKEKADGESGSWPYGETIDRAIEFGAQVEEMGVDEICVDEESKLVTTPAFMYAGHFHEIQDGVSKMIEKVVELI